MDNKIIALNRFFELCFANPKGSTADYLKICTPDTDITTPAIWGHIEGTLIKEGSAPTTIDFGPQPTTQAGYSKFFAQLSRIDNSYIPTLKGIPNQEKMSRVFANPLGAFEETEEKADTTSVSYNHFLNLIQERFGGKIFVNSYIVNSKVASSISTINLAVDDADGIVGVSVDGGKYSTFDSINIDGISLDLDVKTLEEGTSINIYTIKATDYKPVLVATDITSVELSKFYSIETTWEEFELACNPTYDGVVFFPALNMMWRAECKITNNGEDIVYGRSTSGGVTFTIRPGSSYTYSNYGPSYPQGIDYFKRIVDGVDVYDGVLEQLTFEPLFGTYQIIKSKNHY